MAEFTHEGEHCSFETLLLRFALDEPALVALGSPQPRAATRRG